MHAVDSRILIVDDDDFALDILENTLTRMGYAVVAARNGEEALEILRAGEIKLMITDWDMPVMDGIELCRSVRREDLSGYVYVIMLTGREGQKQRMEGLCAGSDDFINKPVDPEELLICLKTAQRILALETRDLALFAMAKLAESRDSETGAHIERVQSYSRLVAQNLSADVRNQHGVDDAFVRLLHQTSPLHDLGKVAIPDAILLKPGRLTRDEFEIMKTHTLVGAQTLDAALKRFPNALFLQMAREIAESHHEKFDGSGYPRGLAGDQIPLCARIVAVADVYDALTSRRVYKEAMSHVAAMQIIHGGRGGHFDPEIVDGFLRAEQQIVAVRERFADENTRATVELAIPAPPSPGQREHGLCKILVAEDDPILLNKLSELLSATGATVLARPNGAEALQALLEHDPRIVVSDWVMPGMDGVELCRRVRERESADPVHFIMLTAHSDASRLLDAYDAGINDFVSKPFNPEELLARVRAGLRSVRLHDDLLRKAAGSQAMTAQLAVMNSRLERLSITDELTGLFNRRHAMSRLEEQWATAERYSRALTVGMIDIDHFKQINDQHGHDTGDSVLRRVAGILRDQTRGTDAVCRVGGEEFLIIFSGQTSQEAFICVERFRQAVAEHRFDIGGTEIHATVSVGLASRTLGMTQFPDLLKSADQALYVAKRGGRNLVRIAEASELPRVAGSGQGFIDGLDASQPVIDSAPVNFAAVLDRCGGDPVFAAAITEKFRNHAIEEIQKLEKAQSEGNADVMRRTAHSTKSMCAYMSADRASRLAGEIEECAHTGQLAQMPQLIPRLRDEVEQAIAWIDKNQPVAA